MKLNKLTSLDYANLIAWLAMVKHGVHLGKTQLQKLLYIFYGKCLASNGNPPFDDDTPKAFPFGPVFPRSYKRYFGFPAELNQDDKNRFAQKPDILKTAVEVVDSFHMHTASRLSEWTHITDGPWYRAVYSGDKPAWGREISKENITEFFRKEDWKNGL